MDLSFNASEVFEMAIVAERNGVKFYRKAAENAADSDIKQLLLNFASMEAQHELTFTAMKKDFEAQVATETPYDPDGVAVAYLQAIADAKSWEGKAGPDQELTGDESIEDIISIALVAEKEAVAFYAGLKEIVQTADGQSKVDAIIREEMGHVAQLTNILADLKD